jgi:hypothetical protein
LKNPAILILDEATRYNVIIRAIICMQKKIVKYAFTFLKGKDKNKGTKENIY